MVNFILGLTVGGHFSICTKLISIITMICVAISYSFSPQLFNLYSRHKYLDLKKISISTVKITSVVMSILIAIVMVYSEEIIIIWVGSEFIDILPSLNIMLIGLMFSCFIMPTYCISIMYLRMKIPSMVTLGLGLLNIVLTIGFTILLNLDMLGAALSWTILLIIKNCFFNSMYHSKLLTGTHYLFVKNQLSIIAIFLLSYGVNYCIHFWLIPNSI